MIVLTDNAASVIRGLTRRPGLAEGTGLRISTNRARGTLTLSLAAGPASEDTVIQREGAVLFLDPVAARALEGKSLDATVDGDGKTSFAVADQED